MDTPLTLSKFEIRKTLGKGGMGTVYLGHDRKLHRDVAIKTIRRKELDDDEMLAEYSRRFELEAKAIAKLNHPNIVRVYESGEEQGTAFLVMEFVEGHDLKYYFDQKIPFSLTETLRLMTDLLEALAHAHDKGVWHRDIKPANVMIDATGQVKLTDFGVSRIADNNERSRIGTMVGTLNYMSPEQVLNSGVTHRSDIFAAGVILYEFLTQTRPFTGGDYELSNKIVKEEATAPSLVNPGLPQRLDAVLAKALAKRPDQRYATAREFIVDLKHAIGDRIEPMLDPDATRHFYASQGTKYSMEAKSDASRPQSSSGDGKPKNSENSGSSTSPSENAEIEFWRSIKDGTDPDEYSLYLTRFPQGTYAALASKRIERYGGTKPPALPSRAPNSGAGNAKVEPSIPAGGGKIEPSFNDTQETDDAKTVLTATPKGPARKRPAWLVPILALVTLSIFAGAFWISRNPAGPLTQLAAAEKSAVGLTAAGAAGVPGASASAASVAVSMIASAIPPAQAVATLPASANPSQAGSAPPVDRVAEKRELEALRKEAARSKETAKLDKNRREDDALAEAQRNAARVAQVTGEATDKTAERTYQCLSIANMTAGDASKTEAESCTAAKAKVNAWVAQWKTPAGVSKGQDKFHNAEIGECSCQGGACSVEIRYLKQQSVACE